MTQSKNLFNRNPGFLVTDLARLMRKTFNSRVHHIGLTRTQWFVVAHLYRTDGQTQRELADELDMEPAPLGRLIDRLEEDGWVCRKADPHDRRAKRVHLTDKILPNVDELRAAAEGVYADAFEGTSDEQYENFLDILTRAKTNLSTNSENQE